MHVVLVGDGEDPERHVIAQGRGAEADVQIYGSMEGSGMSGIVCSVLGGFHTICATRKNVRGPTSMVDQPQNLHPFLVCAINLRGGMH